MAYVLRQLYGFYKYYMIEYSGKFEKKQIIFDVHLWVFFFIILFADPRSENLPLVSFPATYGLLAVYLFGVLHLGPRLMEKRQPFRIKNLLIVYNALQILVNIYVWFYVSDQHFFAF